MPFTGEHAARIRDPGEFEEFRRVNDHFGPGIDVIFGIKGSGEMRTSDVQAIRFDSGFFTVAAAREWLKEHDFEIILFEEAIPESEVMREAGLAPNSDDSCPVGYPFRRHDPETESMRCFRTRESVQVLQPAATEHHREAIHQPWVIEEGRVKRVKLAGLTMWDEEKPVSFAIMRENGKALDLGAVTKAAAESGAMTAIDEGSGAAIVAKAIGRMNGFTVFKGVDLITRVREGHGGIPIDLTETEAGAVGLAMGPYHQELMAEVEGALAVGLERRAMELQLVMESIHKMLSTVNGMSQVLLGRYELIGLMIGLERFKRVMDDHVNPLEQTSLAEDPTQDAFKAIRAALDSVQAKVVAVDKSESMRQRTPMTADMITVFGFPDPEAPESE